jgi:hypothetical protein
VRVKELVPLDPPCICTLYLLDACSCLLPPFFGEIFELDHIQDSGGRSISLEVLSLNPRVFDIRNFFSPDESNALIDNAMKKTSPTHGLHRSMTGGVGEFINSKRISENAWDTGGASAQKIKR